MELKYFFDRFGVQLISKTAFTLPNEVMNHLVYSSVQVTEKTRFRSLIKVNVNVH
jgi:hypothetical protein